MMLILNTVLGLLAIAFIASLVILAGAVGDAMGVWEGWVSWA